MLFDPNDEDEIMAQNQVPAIFIKQQCMINFYTINAFCCWLGYHFYGIAVMKSNLYVLKYEKNSEDPTSWISPERVLCTPNNASHCLVHYIN